MLDVSDVRLCSSNAGDGHVALNHHLIGRKQTDKDGRVADRLRPERVSHARVDAEAETQYRPIDTRGIIRKGHIYRLTYDDAHL